MKFSAVKSPVTEVFRDEMPDQAKTSNPTRFLLISAWALTLFASILPEILAEQGWGQGMFWAWWMHFLQDVAIFIFLAMGALTPGGG